MSQQHGHAAGEFALFAFPHVFDLVGQMFDVELGKAALAQQARLLLGPENDVLFVGSRRLSPACLSCPASRSSGGLSDAHCSSWRPAVIAALCEPGQRGSDRADNSANLGARRNPIGLRVVAAVAVQLLLPPGHVGLSCAVVIGMSATASCGRAEAGPRDD
jgi:hypothetical protein